MYPSQLNKKNYLSVVLFLNSRCDGFHINYQIAVLDIDENVTMVQSSSACEMKDLKNGVGSMHWIAQTELFTKASKLLDNTLLRIILRLELTIPAPLVTMASGYPLSIQYQKLFDCEKHKDFTIITSDRKRIPVHKNILANRSLVFEHMLEDKKEESHKSEVEIDNADYKTMLEFVRYIYYGEVHDIDSIAPELLYIAHKYQVYDLQEPCVAAIAKKIKVSNVFTALKIADIVRERELKKFCFEFIKW